MRLRDYTLIYLSVALLLIIGIWAAIFYVNMLDEVYDSIDDGLDNYKMLIIEKAEEDTTVLHKSEFAESNYSIRPVTEKEALSIKDLYFDTLMYMKYEEDFEPVRLLRSAFATSDGRHFELKVISSMVEEDDLIEDLLYSLLWLYLIIVVTMVIVNTILIRRIWAPFYKTIAQLKQFKFGGKQSFNASKTNVREFAELNTTIQRLLERNEEVFESQKQFIENAAHELQTPLAVCINKLELFVESADLKEEEMENIGTVLANLERLTRMNKSLLLLSKIENKQFESLEPIHLNTLILKTISDFEDFTRHKKITVDFLNLFPVHSRVPADLLQILVSNLLKNAIVHNFEGGEVKITADQNLLIVENTGTSEALDSEQVFSRFYKKSGSKNTTGLGLAIVKAIADSYRLKIEYAFRDGKHVFKVILR